MKRYENNKNTLKDINKIWKDMKRYEKRWKEMKRYENRWKDTLKDI